MSFSHVSPTQSELQLSASNYHHAKRDFLMFHILEQLTMIDKNHRARSGTLTPLI